MTTIYAIGDIHGEKALLDDIHRQITADAAARAGDKLAVYLGDYIDRGPDSRGVVGALMAGALPFPAVYLMGNHEALCLDPCRNDWLANGGRQTEASYGGAVAEAHREWMRRSPAHPPSWALVLRPCRDRPSAAACRAGPRNPAVDQAAVPGFRRRHAGGRRGRSRAYAEARRPKSRRTGSASTPAPAMAARLPAPC